MLANGVDISFLEPLFTLGGGPTVRSRMVASILCAAFFTRVGRKLRRVPSAVLPPAASSSCIPCRSSLQQEHTLRRRLLPHSLYSSQSGADTFHSSHDRLLYIEKI